MHRIFGAQCNSLQFHTSITYPFDTTLTQYNSQDTWDNDPSFVPSFPICRCPGFCSTNAKHDPFVKKFRWVLTNESFLKSTFANHGPYWLFGVGSTTFRYPYGWGLDSADLIDGCDQEQNQVQSNKQSQQVNAVKRECGNRKETSSTNKMMPTRRTGFLFFPSPQNHFDDIFLSSAGLDQ